MSIEPSFHIPVNIQGKNIEVTFIKSDKGYTYECSDERVRDIVEKALQSHPKNETELRGKVSQLQTEFAFETLQKTAAGREFSSWLTAFNTGPLPLKEVHTRWQTPPDRLERDRHFHYYTGGYDLIAIEELDENHVVCLLKEKYSDQYVQVQLATENGKLTAFQVHAVSSPFKIERLNEKELIPFIENYVNNLIERGLFSGTVLIAKGNNELLSVSGGKLPEGDGSDLQFNMGSMNKMFTAIGILQLVEKGMIALDSPIGTVLKNLHPDVAKITFRQLLHHHGGVGDIFDIKEDLFATQDFIDRLNDRGLVEPIGEFHYSNYGFVLMGAAIEELTNMTYYDYVQRNILNKAGMTSTQFPFRTEQAENRAVGYMRDLNQEDCPLVENTEKLPLRGTPAGGGYSTARDLLHFANALEQGVLLDPSLLKTAERDAVPTGWGEQYGLGFFVGDSWYGHTGVAEGINDNFKIFPSSGYYVIILANMDRPAAERVADFIQARLPSAKQQMKNTIRS
jgi:CubicO group peptidase (beta-lactamase class C family)